MAVLFVDDEEMAVRYFAILYEELTDVYVAQDIHEANELLEKHGDTIKLIISDFLIRTDKGDSLLQTCRSRYPAIKRVLLTAVEIGQFEPLVRDGTIQAVLSKPIDVEAVAKLISESCSSTK